MRRMIKACIMMAVALAVPAVSMAQTLPDIFATPNFTLQPTDASVKINATATFKANTYGVFKVLYKWQKYDGSNWVDIPKATKASYSVAKLQPANDGEEYRCIAYYEGKEATAATSNVVVTNVYTATKVKGVKYTNTAGEIVKTAVIFKTASTPEPYDKLTISVDLDTDARSLGGEDFEYFWETKKPGEKIWTTVASGSTLPVQITVDESTCPDKTQLRASVQSVFDAKPIFTKVTQLRVVDLTQAVELDPKAQAFPGQKATIKLKLTSSFGSMKYQWQDSTDGTTWLDIPKATKSAYTTPVLAAADFAKTYRCVLTNPAGVVYTDPIQVMQLEPAGITLDPVPASAGSNTSATFVAQATAESGAAVKFTWYMQLPGATTWKSAGAGKIEYVAGTNIRQSTLTVSKPKTATMNGALYKCVVSNYDSTTKTTYTDESATAMLTVYDPLKITTQPKLVKSYEKTDHHDIPAVYTAGASGATNAQYQWQISFDGKNFTDVAGENSSTFSFLYDGQDGDLTKASKYYWVRCKIWEAGQEAAAVYTTAAKSTVYKSVVFKEIQFSQGLTVIDQLGLVDNEEIDAFTNFDFKLNALADGYSINYKWYQSEDGVTWTFMKSSSSLGVKITDKQLPYVRYYKVMLYNASAGEAVKVIESKAVKVTLKGTYNPATGGIQGGIFTLNMDFNYKYIDFNNNEGEESGYPYSYIKIGAIDGKKNVSLFLDGSIASETKYTFNQTGYVPYSNYVYKRHNHEYSSMELTYAQGTMEAAYPRKASIKFYFNNASYDDTTKLVHGRAVITTTDNYFSNTDNPKELIVDFTYGANRGYAPLSITREQGFPNYAWLVARYPETIFEGRVVEWEIITADRLHSNSGKGSSPGTNTARDMELDYKYRRIGDIGEFTVLAHGFEGWNTTNGEWRYFLGYEYRIYIFFEEYSVVNPGSIMWQQEDGSTTMGNGDINLSAY